MFIFKKLYCRAFQGAFRGVLPFLPYREPRILSSYGELIQALKKENSTAVLMIAGKTVTRHRLVEPLELAMQNAGIKYVTYDKTQPNPTVANVEEALSLYLESRCDAIIAVGGGSAIDCAKAVGARVAHPNKSLRKMGGVMRVTRKLPTLIAIPTTAGTGSEVTLASVITDDKAHHKYAIMSFPLIPHYAMLDASLTYSLPPQLTATTGMDALTHAVEAYIGRSTTKKTRALALEATRLVFGNIERAYTDGKNSEARENMLLASYKAGIAFSMSYVGYVHAIAHSIGGKYGTPHGLANAVILPRVLEGYGKSAWSKLHRLGIAAGVCNESDSAEIGATKFISAIKELNARMNIPAALSEIVISDIPELARHAAREANPLYPVPKLMSAAELEKIFHEIADHPPIN